MKSSEFCKKADKLVGGPRSKVHGEKMQNHLNIAAMWQAYLECKGVEVELSASDVTKMLALLKIARTFTGQWNEDDYVDGIGYLAISGELSLDEA